MYKLLPILLFAFLIAEVNIPTIGQNFNYKNNSEWELVDPEDFIAFLLFENAQLEIQKVLNPNLFIVNVSLEIVEIAKINIMDSDSLNSLVEEIQQKYIEAISFYKISENNNDYDILIARFKIRIGMDKSISLTGDTKEMVWVIVETTFGMERDDCGDCLVFNSIDINELKNNNEQLSLQRDDIYDDSWAVIIGIDKYKYSDQLNYAVKDAEAVKDMLIDKFDYPIENIRYLVDDEATLSKIKLALDDISTSADENDRVLVFYSGHGETQKNNDGTETGYIIPVEGRQEKPYATGLAMDDILRTCQMSNAKHMLFLMDACYSGLMTENVKGLSKPQEEGYLSKVANEKARQIITAGGGGELVIERDEWQHSAFTKNLLAGLDNWESDTDNDGYVTADELGTYLRKSVTEDSDFQQTPQKGRFRNSGGGEFVFFSNHNAVNQNVEDKSADEKLDYLISEMEELKVQSTVGKTKPDLKVNPDKQQFDKVLHNTWDSDYPLVFRFIYIDKSVFLGATKHYDGMHLLGLVYGYTIWEKKDDFAEIDHPTYGDYVKHYMHFIGPVAGRRLFVPEGSWLKIEPIALFSMGIMFKRVENQDLGISEETNDFYYSLTLYNRFRVTKTIGFSLGISIGNEYFHNFDGDNRLYVVYERVNLSPLLTIDITNPFSKKKG